MISRIAASCSSKETTRGWRIERAWVPTSILASVSWRAPIASTAEARRGRAETMPTDSGERMESMKAARLEAGVGEDVICSRSFR